MAKALVVVESPAKAKTINKYLGKDYKVVASMGHIRDLPKSKLGVDVDGGFTPVYDVIPARKKVIKELRDAAKGVDHIYVATDPDREGEAIGWHLAKELGTKKRTVSRLTFNEITRSAVLAALDQSGEIDQRMVDAQQARRVLDRLVGYKLSPLLWDKVRRGLSAGRVQSVALKLVCDREALIEAFVPEEYWHITARLAGGAPPEFDAKLVKRGKDVIKVGNEKEATAILATLKSASYAIQSVTTKERKKHAAPPFITSKLQQASRFSVKRTMLIAQQLYEGIELPGEDSVGLITYMRTDSTRVSEQALGEVRDHISGAFGDTYLPGKPNKFRTKKDAQDAHEAIRPTAVANDPESVKAHLTEDQFYLYRLIWSRFVASQMLPATFDDTTLDVSAVEYVLRAKGSVPKFNGWMAVYEQPQKDGQSATTSPEAEAEADADGATGLLPALSEGDALELKTVTPEQKFTQPPARFSEATLVKELEENGIGRPSTYASIIGVLQVREYAEKVEGRFRPSRLGRLVTDLLAKSFDRIIQVDYTREMEERLDEIEAGKADYEGTLDTFYKAFKDDLAKAAKSMPDIKTKGLPSDETCEKCQSPMIIKVGKFGMFLACSAYPDCKTTRKLITTAAGVSAAKPDQVLDEKCPKCEANLVVKQGRFGEFTACSSYPKCRYVKLKSVGVSCPNDAGDLVERKSRRGRVFYGCANYPDCDFTLWNKPLQEICPTCKAPFLVEKVTKRHGRQVLCHKEDCDYIRSEELAEA